MLSCLSLPVYLRGRLLAHEFALHGALLLACLFFFSALFGVRSSVLCAYTLFLPFMLFIAMLLGDDLALKHMIGADPIMGRTFRTPWWDPTYDSGHSWAPHPEPTGEVCPTPKLITNNSVSLIERYCM